ncbi:ATP-binding cassette, subfamily C [Cohaesibacter marisflavi]|uniref:ATP-binding cassette, subfamily C n=1 Tax=Cohaesibacter marisflavi TaxID=655353 RepID=A0A1I5I4C7_9HYPH|nr:type I secretion system permease/ATPase [Cohaesibacter marisflavi]SFO55387.1 ATP-binding cassette, subfamily C [Cohaesibacter marisflavi]
MTISASQNNPVGVGIVLRFGVWLLVFSISANLLLLAMPIYLSQIYDRVLPSDGLDTLLYLTLLILFCIGLFSIFEILRRTVAQKLSVHYELRTKSALLEHGVKNREIDRTRLASLLNDVTTVRQFLSGRGLFSIFDLPFVPIFLAILFFVHPWIGAVASLGALILLFLALGNELMASRHQHNTSRLYQQSTAKSSEILRHLDDVCAMGMGKAQLNRWQRTIVDAVYSSNELSAVNGVFFGLVRFARQAIQIMILGCSAYLVMSEHLSAGLIFASSIISGRALMPIEQFVGSYKQLTAASVANNRLKHWFNGTQDASNMPAPLTLPEIKGYLRSDNVSLVPPGATSDKALLRGISFEVEPGEVIAIVGSSGAGKSTLMRVLASVIRPSMGKVSIDGFELEQWDPEQLGAEIGYAGQESDFFHGTVAENIARFNPDASDEAIVNAALNAGAHEFIGSLPQGYNTNLDTVSFNLSGGQKQRINLARAFFGDPQILLLDEPDAHLDKEGERALVAAIANARARGKTVLFVTQRMHLVNSANKVLIVDNGMVVKFGPREALMAPRDTNRKTEAIEDKSSQKTLENTDH